jgi:membrane-bound lytic murein transglycosylase A
MNPFQRSLHWMVASLTFLVWAAACSPTPPPHTFEAPSVMVPLALEDFPEFTDDVDYDGLLEALRQSMVYLNRLPQERQFDFGGHSYDKIHMQRSLARFAAFIATRPDPARLNQFIRTHYRIYKSSGRPPDGEVLFTGYFEPLYPGSLAPTTQHTVPVYGVPDDLITVDLGAFAPDLAGRRVVGRVAERRLQPYYTRAQILNDGVLAGKAPIIAWMNDPLDLYFLQVQGSGRIQTPDGKNISLLYAAQNGYAADLVGRHLIRENKVPAAEMSMQRIRRYFQDNPAEKIPMLNRDPSFVFFRRGSSGPLGNLGVEITPGRSIATDRRIFPAGALAYIDTRKPLVSGDLDIAQWAPLQRFVLNQDTGGAIKGPGRADLFWGYGAYAETAAGHMKHTGALYFLVLNAGAPPAPAAAPPSAANPP